MTENRSKHALVLAINSRGRYRADSSNHCDESAQLKREKRVQEINIQRHSEHFLKTKILELIPGPG